MGRWNDRLTRFAGAVDDQLADGPLKEKFWRCAGVFAEFAREGLADLVNQELAVMLADPAHRPGNIGSNGDVNLLDTDRYTLVARIVEANDLATTAYSSGGHYLLSVLGPGSETLLVDRFEQSVPEPNDVFDRNRPIVFRGRQRLARGEVLPLRAAVDVVRLSAAAPVAILLLVSAPLVPLTWQYDLASGRPLRALSASVDASRLEYSVRLLGELGDPASVPRLLDLTRHPLHFVRWAAVRAVLSIEPGRAVEVLTTAAADPHPHVRRAAERSLQQIERRAQSGAHL